eukprot:2838973-Amphidinium_carterae.1
MELAQQRSREALQQAEKEASKRFRFTVNKLESDSTGITSSGPPQVVTTVEGGPLKHNSCTQEA